MNDQTEHSKPLKSKRVALFLSFLVPGLGILYAGYTRRFLWVYLTFLSTLFLGLTISFHYMLLYAFLLIAVLDFIFGLVNSYRAAKNPVYSRYDHGANYFLIFLLHGFLSTTVVLPQNREINFAYIPTPAMSPTLEVGDYLTFQTTNKIDRNVVTLFKYPHDQEVLYIKRCVGMPGDSLEIRDGQAFYNNTTDDDLSRYKFRYRIESSRTLSESAMTKFGITEFYPSGKSQYFALMTKSQAKNLQQLDVIKRVEPQYHRESEPRALYHAWGADRFGPLLIPKAGSQIRLTPMNVAIYNGIIQGEEPEISYRNTQLWKEGLPLETYTFQKNYYFMMGDNRHNSNDSRYSGLIPEDLIVGKALYFYWSTSLNRIGKEVW